MLCACANEFFGFSFAFFNHSPFFHRFYSGSGLCGLQLRPSPSSSRLLPRRPFVRLSVRACNHSLAHCVFLISTRPLNLKPKIFSGEPGGHRLRLRLLAGGRQRGEAPVGPQSRLARRAAAELVITHVAVKSKKPFMLVLHNHMHSWLFSSRSLRATQIVPVVITHLGVV